MLYMLEQKGLNAKSYDTMFQRHSDFNYDPGDEKPKHPAYMGMSLEIRETPFGKSFGHGGNNGDFKCKFEVYKDGKWVMSFLQTPTHPTRYWKPCVNF